MAKTGTDFLPVHPPCRFIWLWFLVSNALVIWDTCYVFLRPHSFAGGKYHAPFKPYALYQNIDYVYGLPAFTSHNGFTQAQASLNIFETSLNILYLYLATKKSPVAVLVGFAAVCLTVSKTVLYGLNEYFSGFSNIGHNDLRTLVVYWILPNGWRRW